MPRARASRDTKTLADLSRGSADVIAACERVVESSIGQTLRDKKIRRLRLDRTICTRIGEDVVIHGSIPLGDRVTKLDLKRQATPVGVLVNTAPLLDLVSRRVLGPGASLVELRPIGSGGFAFDFLGDNNQLRMGTLASPANPDRFDAIPDDVPLVSRRLSLIDGDIIDGSDPDDPFPPGGPIAICVSFLDWWNCWIIGTGPTFPQPPIFV